jgi:hypothetical protein
LIDAWKNDTRIYFRDVLGVDKIWRLQDELLLACPRAIKEHKHIYIASGHSLGKDWTCGGIALWFLHCYSPSIVIETAPTDRQVKKVMWGETMAHWHNKVVDLGGKPYTDPYLEIRKEDWYLIGFTTKEGGASAQASGGKFQGFHSPNVCVIVTEAQAVEDNIFDQIDAVTTNENVLVIFLGNPTRASGRFAKGLRDKKNNIVFNFSCLDNPNYVQKKKVIPGLCSYEWVEDKRTKWGESDPRWQGRVLGQIPDKSINNIFKQKDIDIGLTIKDCPGKRHNNGVAMDVSGEGDDDNVIYAGKRGLVLDGKIKNISNPSTNAIDCLNMCEAQEGNFVLIDCDGLGIGTWQEIVKIPLAEDRYHIIKFHGSTRFPKDPIKNPDNYENLRAKATFTALKRLQEGKASIPNDELLHEELLEVKYFENKRGLIQIEENEDLKERLLRSPDRMMAWIMLQYGFSLELDPKDPKKRRDVYFDETEELSFNPRTV